jgi:hypothetical protein
VRTYPHPTACLAAPDSPPPHLQPQAAIEVVRTLPFGPGKDCVFVANEWHSALVPLPLKVSAPPPPLPEWLPPPHVTHAMAARAWESRVPACLQQLQQYIPCASCKRHAQRAGTFPPPPMSGVPAPLAASCRLPPAPAQAPAPDRACSHLPAFICTHLQLSATPGPSAPVPS